MAPASMGMAARAIGLHIATLRPGAGNMIDKYNKMLKIQKAADDGAGLSQRQSEAESELPDYRIDHFTPDDIGKTLGGFLALIGGPAPGRPTEEPGTANR